MIDRTLHQIKLRAFLVGEFRDLAIWLYAETRESASNEVEAKTLASIPTRIGPLAWTP